MAAYWCLGEYSILPSRGALCQYRSAGETGKLKDALDDVMVAKYKQMCLFVSDFQAKREPARDWPDDVNHSKRASGRTHNRSDCRADEEANRSDCRERTIKRTNERTEQACRLLVYDEKTFRFTFCSDDIKLYAFTIHNFYAEMEINH